MKEKCIKCNEGYSYVKKMCSKCYWNDLYHKGRIHTKNGRGKAKPIPVMYFDSNLSWRASPELELLFNGTK